MKGFVFPSWVPVIAIGKDILTVIGFGLIYATTSQYLIEPRIWGKACTAVQLGLIVYCLLAPDIAGFLPQVHTIFTGLYWLAIVAMMDYIHVGNRFVATHHAKQQGKNSHE